jgi:dienelactone hydrolase
VALGLAALLVILFRAPLLAGARTALLIPDLLVFQPARPSVSFTLAPSRRELAWADGERGDLYLPTPAIRSPAIVVILGVYPAALDDPAVRRLGDGLARTGIVALIPDSPRLREGHVTLAEIDAIVGAVEALRQMPEVDPDRIGLVGLSVGGGLALLAAEDDRIAGSLASVYSVGGYASALDLLRAIGGRATVDPGRPAWAPSDLAIIAYRRQLIDTLTSPVDRESLEAAFLAAEPAPVDAGRLTPEGRTILALLEGGDPETIDQLLGRLPPAAIRTLQRLSPIERIDAIRAPVFLIHDVNDPYVPVGETRRLAAELGSQANMREYDLFAHVVPSGGGNPLRLPGELAGLAGQLYRWFRLVDGE